MDGVDTIYMMVGLTVVLMILSLGLLRFVDAKDQCDMYKEAGYKTTEVTFFKSYCEIYLEDGTRIYARDYQQSRTINPMRAQP